MQKMILTYLFVLNIVLIEEYDDLYEIEKNIQIAKDKKKKEHSFVRLNHNIAK
jgi:hypothetical protein